MAYVPDQSLVTPAMYVDIRRGLVFFDRSDRVLGSPPLTRYDPRTNLLHPMEGARHDDVVCDISQDGTRLILRSAGPLIVRGHNRSRITVLVDGMPPRMTDRVYSHWSVFSPDGCHALVGTLSAAGRPLVMDTATCDFVAAARPGINARFGEPDPVDGRLWVPHTRFENTVLSLDCATGSTDKVRLPAGNRIMRVRFARDGSSLLAVGEKGTLSRHKRDGSVIWLVDVSGIGPVGAGDLFLNGAGSHILLSLLESRNSEWGEDLVIGMNSGRVEHTIPRHRGPPARLAADWFGDHVLTHAGEVVDFFSGQVVGELSLQGH